MGTFYRDLFPVISQRIQNECMHAVEINERGLIALPHTYSVSAIRNSELMFYWPTYFYNLGLIRLKLVNLAKQNASNLVFLQHKYGYIPSANHKKYLQQTSPPFLPLIVRDVYRATGSKDWLRRVLPEVKNEFKVWYAKPWLTSAGLVSCRYQDSNDSLTGPKQIELNWWQGSRCKDSNQCIPVDLNALLYLDASIIEDLGKEIQDDDKVFFQEKAGELKKAIEICWDDTTGFYYDYDLSNNKLLKMKTLAGFTPMFSDLVKMRRAERIVDQLEAFSCKFGPACTDHDYGNKNSAWNFPNGSAPLVWIVVKSLLNYDFVDEARELARRWLDLVFRLYQDTGEFWEQYNVVEGKISNNDPLSNVPIMGWTAGIYVELVETFGFE